MFNSNGDFFQALQVHADNPTEGRKKHRTRDTTYNPRGVDFPKYYLTKPRAPVAGWQSGYAAACKAVDAGSIPTPASIFTPYKAVFAGA